jgi:threonine dehydratase
MNPSFADIQAATKLIRPHLEVTPLLRSNVFSEMCARDVHIKWDNTHRTGSFKERGALHALLRLSPEEQAKGVITASAGNHALALSFHARRLNIPCTVVMPVRAPLVKVQSAHNYGAEVILHGDTFDEAYQHAIFLAEKTSRRRIPPYDDVDVVAGQGSCGIEIHEQLPEVDAVFVPVGGGGLISGIAIALKELRPRVKIIGVQSEWAVQHRSAPTPSAQLPSLPPATIADGIAVKRIGQITKPIIEQQVDTLLTASESSIAQAVVHYIEHEHTVIEGAGAAALAGLLSYKLPREIQRIVVLACGSNIDINVLSRLLERDMGERGRLLHLKLSVPDKPGSLSFVTSIMAREGANILEVIHDRSFSKLPGNVDITFELEVRNKDHGAQILAALKNAQVHTLVGTS